MPATWPVAMRSPPQPGATRLAVHPIVVYNRLPPPQLNPPRPGWRSWTLLSHDALQKQSPPPCASCPLILHLPRCPRQPRARPAPAGQLPPPSTANPSVVNMAEAAFQTKSMKRRNIRNLALNGPARPPPTTLAKNDAGDALEIGV